MNFPGLILKWLGWKIDVTVPDYPKCIICVAPHTSNIDFFVCKLAYSAVGRNAGFLMKAFWFFPPLGWVLRSIGGIPVYRKKKKGSLVKYLVDRFENSERFSVAITPEGTRSPNSDWHTGFLEIAFQTGIPVVLAKVDYATKTVSATDTFTPTGDVRRDMSEIKEYYRGVTGKHPENFII